MAKRGATTELNHDNWDDDYEAEEAGSFKVASECEILKRKIKTAKRRSNLSANSASSSPFAGFVGFKPQTPNNKPMFNLSNTNSTPVTNGSDSTRSSVTSNTPLKTNIPNSTDNKREESARPEDEYAANLSSLNKNVSEWIKTHVEKNPLCVLTPIFSDYERYLKEIKEKRDLAKSNVARNDKKSPLLMYKTKDSKNSKGEGKSQHSIFNLKESESSEKKDGKSPLLMFKTKVTESSEEDKKTPFLQFKSPIADTPVSSSSSLSMPSSIFGNVKTDPLTQSSLLKPDPASLMVNPFTTKMTSDKPLDSTPKPFSFGAASSQPFTFSNVTAPPPSSNTAEQEEESDEPPKVDFKPVQEEGAVFSKRCKVFIKKDSSYTDRGIGTLHVKKVSEAKYQLLVRADTVLGNILINVLLSNSIPLQRMGKNNVMLVCLPTPDSNPPPTTVLLRVKTSEEADELLKNLERYKN